MKNSNKFKKTGPCIIADFLTLSLCQEQNSTRVTNRTCKVICTSYAII